MLARTSPVARWPFVVLLAAFGVLGGGVVLSNWFFTRRSAACRQIRRGATLAEIQNVLGPGIGPERSRQPGWLFFGGDAVREDSFIRARIRPDGVVTELWCTDTRDSWNP
jgi:hypothetical protein